MPHKRFQNNQIKENINEAEFIKVPGIEFFNRDCLNTYLGKLDDASLNINLSLLLNKYPWWFGEGNGTLSLERKFKEFKLDKNGHQIIINGRPVTKSISHHYKEEVLEEIVRFSAKSPANYQKVIERHYSVPDNVTLQSVILTTKTRLIVGLSGSASIFETSITLHPYYGFPVIPGSAIKGVTRHFCEEFKSGEIDGATIRKIFGHKPGEQKLYEGDVVFYDAFPEEWPKSSGNLKPLLEIDIMNPHYKDYYKEGSNVLPADNQDPLPLKFLVVRKGIKFRFAVRPSAKCKDASLSALALSLMKEALTTIGIGAKTGSSYGYFK